MSEDNLAFMLRMSLEAIENANKDEIDFERGYKENYECWICKKRVKKLRGKRCMNGYLTWYCPQCF